MYRKSERLFLIWMVKISWKISQNFNHFSRLEKNLNFGLKSDFSLVKKSDFEHLKCEISKNGSS
jgi:hypothetical protein